MRESVGGTLLLQIVLVFLAVYIAFMAVVINYGKVFRNKNSIVNYIEQNEGIIDCGQVGNYIRSLGYLDNYELVGSETDKGIIYSVKVYIVFGLPLINTPISIPIGGETRLISTGNLVSSDDIEAITCTERDS